MHIYKYVYVYVYIYICIILYICVYINYMNIYKINKPLSLYILIYVYIWPTHGSDLCGWASFHAPDASLHNEHRLGQPSQDKDSKLLVFSRRRQHLSLRYSLPNHRQTIRQYNTLYIGPHLIPIGYTNSW